MKNNIIKIGALFLGISLVSCLDDSKYALDPAGTNNTIGFLDPSVPLSPAGSVYPVWIQAFPVSTEDSFERTIKFEGPNSNDKDIELTLAVDPTALDVYNAQMVDGLDGAEPLGGDTYELLPSANYELADLTVTIPKGERTGTLSVTIFPDQFDLSKKYALPIRIVSSSSGVINAHFSVGIFALVVKNQFDGAYDLKMASTGWGAFGIYDSQVKQTYPDDGMGLATTGPATVQCANLWAGTNLVPGWTPTGATQFGDASPIFTFDLNQTAVDIDNNPGTPAVMVHKMTSVVNAITPFAPRFRFMLIDAAAPAHTNWFNPADRSASLQFILQQSGRPDMINYFDLTFREER
jgi:hypothetical protein